jgi:SAM-dependent methyltransferase
MKEYFSGEKLFGNDFNIDQINEWYNQEAEGYAHLGNNDKTTYSYNYQNFNYVHGFSKIPERKFDQVLGLGSAWGFEFEPIVDRISNLTIIEPSNELLNNLIGDLVPKYVKPAVNGELPFDDNVFDLITCFGTLHHIPNVTFVLEEMIRVLKPDGCLLIREPIVSMGTRDTCETF